MPRISPLLSAILAICMAITAIVQSVPPLSAQDAARPVLRITGIDQQDLPILSATVYGANLGGDLKALPAQLKEDGVEQPILGAETVDIGIQTAFLIDASSNIRDPGNTGEPRFTEIANGVDRFVQMHLLSAETDWLAAYTIGQSENEFKVLSDWTQDHQGVANTLRLYDPQETPIKTPLFNLIKYGLDQLEQSDAPDNLRRSLVVFSDGFDSLSALQIDDIVARANRQGVTVHTVMVGPEAEARRQNLQRIADATDGVYSLYGALEDMETLWRQLAAERRQVRYSYRLTQEQPQELEIAVTAPSGKVFTAQADFPAINAQPAVVAVLAPAADLVVTRTGEASDTPLPELQPTTLPIQLDIQWPDGHQRTFDRIEFEISGQTETLNTGPFDAFAFPIDALDTGFYTLRVTAVDELGIESKAAPVSFRVETVRPTPTPSPTPEPTFTPTAVITPAVGSLGAAGGAAGAGAGGGIDGTPAPGNSSPGGSSTGATTTAAGWSSVMSFTVPGLNALVDYGATGAQERELHVGTARIAVNPVTVSIVVVPLVLLLLALAFAGRRSRPEPATVAATAAPYGGDTLAAKSTMIDATAYELTEDVTEPQVLSDLFEAPAYLEYVDGGSHLPHKLDIEGGREVRIGRKSSYCDVIIDDQRVSRLHASIAEKDDGNFYIKDEGSSGGTFVNKRKLRAKDEHLLEHGDTINFNTVAYRFILADKQPGEAKSTNGKPVA